MSRIVSRRLSCLVTMGGHGVTGEEALQALFGLRVVGAESDQAMQLADGLYDLGGHMEWSLRGRH